MGKDFRISDIVDPSAIKQLKELQTEYSTTLTAYSALAIKLAGGVKIKPQSLEEMKAKSVEYTAVMEKLGETQNKLSKLQADYCSLLDKVNISQKESISNAAKANTELKKEADAQTKTSSQKKVSIQLTEKEKTLIESALGSRADNIKRLADEEVAIKQLSEQKKKIDQEEKNGLITIEQAMNKRQSLISSELEHKQAKSELLNILKNEEKLNQSTSGSYTNLSLTLEKMRKAYRLMSEEEKKSATGVGVNEKIAELDKVLKEADAQMGINARNVGDYEISTKSLKSELRSLTEQLATMKMEGKDGTKEFQDMIQRAGELKDAMGDTNQQINAYASDTGKLDTAKQGIDSIVQSYMMWKMATESLGIQNKELDEFMRTLMGTLSLLQAAIAVSNALESQSALMTGIATVKKWLFAKATIAQAAATAAQAVATGTATAAQIALNVAMKASPIGWLLVIIGAVIGAIYGLVEAFQYFISDSEKRREAIEKEGDSLEEFGEQSDKYLKSLKERGESESKILSETIRLYKAQENMYKEHFKIAMKEYEEDEDGYKRALQQKKEATEKLNDTLQSSADYFRKMVKQSQDDKMASVMGKVAFATKKANDEYKEMSGLLYQLRREGVITEKEFKDALDAASTNEQRQIGDAEEEQAEKFKDAKKKELDAIRVYQDSSIALIEGDYERQQAIVKKTYDRNIEDLKMRLKTENDLSASARIAINNTIVNLEKQKDKELLKLNEDRTKSVIEEDLKNYLDSTDKGTQKYFDTKFSILEKEYEKEMKAAEQSGANISFITMKYERLRTDILAEFASDKNKKIQEQYAAESVIVSYQMQDELDAVSAKYAQGLIDKETYEVEKAKIAEKYAIQQAQAAIDLAKLQIETENLSPEDKMALKQKIAEAEIALAKAVADAKINEFERAEEAQETSLAKIADRIQMVGDILNQFSELGSAIFDRKIAEVEDQQDANDEAFEKEVDQIAKLEENGAISKEEAEARKRAAEERTATKNEELEKKKADLQNKQAKMDKANAIAQCIIQTALAAIKVWGQTGIGGIALAPIVIALGAVQLATIMATPIPKYAKGTDNHPGGLAIVGDGGKQEAIMTPSGKSYITPDIPTLVEIPKYSKVIPDIAKYMTHRGMRSDLPALDRGARMRGESITVNVNNDFKKLERKFDTLTQSFNDMAKSNRKLAAQADLNWMSKRV